MDRFATFEADFPDDTVEEHDEIVLPGGRNVAEAVGARLRANGFDATAPEQHSFYGWSFEFAVHGLRAFVLLQRSDAWLLIVEIQGGLLTRKRHWEAALEQAIAAVEGAMANDVRIAPRTWMTRHVYEAR
jgi:hypothetical protein